MQDTFAKAVAAITLHSSGTNWRVDQKADYGELNTQARQRINLDRIAPHWDDVLRLIGSLQCKSLTPLFLGTEKRLGGNRQQLRQAERDSPPFASGRSRELAGQHGTDLTFEQVLIFGLWCVERNGKKYDGKTKNGTE